MSKKAYTVDPAYLEQVGTFEICSIPPKFEISEGLEFEHTLLTSNVGYYIMCAMPELYA